MTICRRREDVGPSPGDIDGKAAAAAHKGRWCDSDAGSHSRMI